MKESEQQLPKVFLQTGIQIRGTNLYTFVITYVSRRTKKKKKKSQFLGVPVVAQWLTNPTRNHGVAGSVPGLA